MADKNLRYFMRPEAKEEPVVKADGPDTILGEDGKPIVLEIKVLSNAHIREINEAYRERKIATDKRGNPIVANGEVVYKVEKDSAKASRHLIAEALVYPDLTDPELQEFFKCYDKVEMVDKVFPRADEFQHVSHAVLAALGLVSEVEDADAEKEITDAKN